MGNLFQGRLHAIDMIRNIALVAEDEVGLVVLVAAAFADGAVETPPALLEYHLRQPYVDAMRVITLAALGAHDQAAFQVVAERAAHHADVLLEHEVVRSGHANHLAVFLLRQVFHAGIGLGTLQ